MASTRDAQGRLRTPARYDTPEWREEILLRHKGGASVRHLAAETGRAKSAIARDLARAREEERAARAADRDAAAAKFRPPDPELNRKPGASVMLGVPGVGLTDVHGHALAAAEHLGLLKRRANSSDAATAVRAERELERLTAQANLRAGLSPDGMATYETPLGRGGYDPADPDEVQRVRRTIREDVQRAGADEELADYLAQTWQPHPLPR